MEDAGVDPRLRRIADRPLPPDARADGVARFVETATRNEWAGEVESARRWLLTQPRG